MNVIAVIPARADSKRLPGKNIRRMGGKPLLVYSVEDEAIIKAIKTISKTGET